MLRQILDTSVVYVNGRWVVALAPDGHLKRYGSLRPAVLEIFSHPPLVTKIAVFHCRCVVWRETGGTLEIIMTRALGEQEYQSAPGVWFGAQPGDRVTRFRSAEQARLRAYPWFEETFTEDLVLVMKDEEVVRGRAKPRRSHQ